MNKKNPAYPSPLDTLTEPGAVSLLRLIAGLLLMLGIVMMIVNVMMSIGVRPGSFILTLISFAMLGLIHVGRLRESVMLMCGGGVLAVWAGAYGTMGIEGSWVGIPAMISLAGWFLGRKSAYMTAIAGSGSVLAMYWLYRDGHTFARTYSVEAITIHLIMIFLVSALIAGEIARTIQLRLRELAESRLYLGALFDSTDDLIWSVDPVHFGLLNYNAALQIHYRDTYGIVIREGLKPESLFWTQAAIESWRDHYRRALTEGAHTVEEMLDKHVFLLHFNVMRRENEVFGVSVFARNITHEREIQRQLDRDSAFQHRLIDSIPCMFCVFDADGHFLMWNSHFRATLGLADHEIATLQPLDCAVPEDRPQLSLIIHRVFTVGEAAGEVQILNVSTGQAIPHLIRGYRCRWDHGYIVIGIGVDISERRAHEQELDQYRQHLEELVKKRTRQLEEAKEAAEVASRAKGTFLANMSHEIRTPMNGVLSVADFLAETPLNSEQAHYLDILRFSSQQLLSIINDVLDFSKIEAGKLVVVNQNFSLRDTLQKILVLMQPLSVTKGLSLNLEIDPGLPEVVYGSSMRLGQIITNLISNAIKFTAQGSVSLTVKPCPPAKSESEPRILFSVTDTGIGIAPEQQEKIFMAFDQAHNGIDSQYGGTGLGLAISSSLVHMMGGQLKVRSELCAGSTFYFDLPLITEKNDDPVVATSVDVQPALTLKGQKVLLVDDNEINRELAGKRLENLGALVTMAEDGAIALDRLDQERFDLILMDMRMPVMDGLTATRLFRTREAERNAPRTPVIALTANAHEQDHQACLEAGMDAHISKPFNQEMLMRGIAEARSRLKEGL